MIRIPQDLFDVLRALKALRGRPYLVGGCVRDALRGHDPKDLDIEVYGIDWETLLGCLRRFGRANVVGRSFAVAKLRLARAEYDFALPRRESKIGAGHRGFLVEADPTLDERAASARRDFTINALLYDPFNDRVLDFHGGQGDLELGLLRHTGPAFADDPLRVLRGFQLAGRFRLSFAPETAALCASVAHTFPELPVERVWGEWEKYATQASHPSAGLRALRESGWLVHFPEIAATVGLPQEPEWHPEGDVFTHTGHCLDALVAFPAWKEANVELRRVLFFATLGHDFGKAETTVRAERHGADRWMSPGHAQAGGPKAEAFLERIGSPLEIRPVVRSLVEHHHAHQSWPPEGPSAPAVRRLARRLAPATIEQLLSVLEADHLGRPPLISAETTQRIWQLRDMARSLALEHAAPAPIVRGRDLIALGLQPGPVFGTILKTAYEAQLEGEFADLPGGVAWIRSRFQLSSREG